MSLSLRRQAIRLYELVNGRHILARFDALNRIQWQSRTELLALQRDKLCRLLRYAYANIPYYHLIFDQVGFQPDDVLVDPALLQKVPVLTKSIIRENFDDLITTEKKRRERMSERSTAGSTGQPLVFMRDMDFRDSVMAEIHHHLTWSGWQFGQPHAYIFGASFEVSYARNLRAQLLHWALNRFITNAYVLSEESMHAFAAKSVRLRPRLISGYASSIYHFAQFIQDHPAYDLRFIDAVFSTSEVLYPAQRQLIEQVFHCKVFANYATRELGALGCECEVHDGMHTSVENAYIEILQDGKPAKPGEPGDILVTNLNNYGMPFIRYQLADVVAWKPDEPCPCGRAHPKLELVEGRHNDLFRKRDGSVVWGGIGNPLWNMEGVKKFQFIQKTFDYVVVKVVKDKPMTQAQRSEVERAVKIALSDQVKLNFEFPDDIPVERSGKHRYQICEIDESRLEEEQST
ncbi:MAG: phenylacetate--CoA ligase family protein [Anaerolineae bacterium]|nr:phenylacetate--CoA ligase family protein [Anaerolineae bacterium]